MTISSSPLCYWLTIALAFVAGYIVHCLAARADRRDAQAIITQAAELMHDVATTLRATGRPLPMALHRRIVDFRGRCGL